MSAKNLSKAAVVAALYAVHGLIELIYGVQEGSRERGREDKHVEQVVNGNLIAVLPLERVIRGKDAENAGPVEILRDAVSHRCVALVLHIKDSRSVIGALDCHAGLDEEVAVVAVHGRVDGSEEDMIELDDAEHDHVVAGSVPGVERLDERHARGRALRLRCCAHW